MDLRDSPDEAAFREELRAWLAENVPDGPPPDDPAERVAFLKDWSRRLHEAGFVGLSWPEEYGGRAAPLTHQAIFLEESARAEAPDHIGVIGLGMAGPTIIAHGTEEQKKRFLEPMLSGEEVWCQGFSEPGAGSDLAALSTRAVADGDGFVISGQKVWSSYAHIADRCILLARTDPDAPKHQGITYFLLDMHADGVEARPLRQITGDAEFNEIFLDEVRVPAVDVLGEVNQGWGVAITTLMNERAVLGFVLGARLEVLFRRLVRLAEETDRGGRPASEDPEIARAIADRYAEMQALRYTNYRALSDLVRKGAPGPEGSIAKLHWAETNQRLTKTALEILGEDAALWDGGRESWQYQQLRSRGNTIEGGTSEILRNIVAERVLGLPKAR